MSAFWLFRCLSFVYLSATFTLHLLACDIFLVFSPIYFLRLQFQDSEFHFWGTLWKGLIPKTPGMLVKRPWKVILEISIFFWVISFNFILHSSHSHELFAHMGLVLSHQNSLLLKFGWPLFSCLMSDWCTMFTGIQRRYITCSVRFGGLDV